jgi:ankyrin repeat protein
MNPDRHQATASGSSSDSQAQGHSAGVDFLVAKFSTNTTATTPEKFANKQKQQQAEAHRSHNNARDNVTGIRLSLRSAMAAVKPKTIANMATNAVLVGRKTSDQPSSFVSSPTRMSVESDNPAFGALVQEDDADQVNRNAVWKIAKAIQSDDASDLFTYMGRCERAMRCHPHPEPESRDSSNEAAQQVGKIYAMLQESTNTSEILSVVLVVSARFSRAAIVRAILTDYNANGVEWLNSQQQCALEHACTNGHLEIATLLACADGTQVCSMLDQSLALRYYCLAGDMHRVQKILAEDSLDVDIGAALLDACINGRSDIVALLTADARFDSSVDGKAGLPVACVNGHVEVVSMLLHDLQSSIPIEAMMAALDLAATAGHCDVVAVLVQDPRVNPGLDKSFALEQYCRAGDSKRVSEVLDGLELDGGLPGAILAAASGDGRTAIVQLLLTDSRVDPSVDENVAIRLASERGHDRVVKLLLADPRVDPGAQNNRAIRVASFNGHDSVVKLLLSDPRVDPAAHNNYAIRYATSRGHVSVVELLLEDPRVDPAAESNRAIRLASENGHAGVVKMLLADLRVDPTARSNKAIRLASYIGHASVVKLLLADPRVDPAAENNWAVQYSSSNGHASVVKLLLEQPQVVVTKAALLAGDEGDHEDIIRLMFEKQPQVILDLFESATPCKSGGSLQSEVHHREKASALTLLLAVERIGVAERVSDVLREVIIEYACFDFVVENEADPRALSSS